ncbi:MAG: GNAT family N-acetyltransferase [Lachnospiraceae bacterium]|nr:GNAT family N-acetyltransferase [Lachnospiraceae bacterium]
MNHIGTIQLETERLILRRFTLDDADSVFNNWASDDEVTRYLTWLTHQSVDDSRMYMEYCVQGYNNLAFYEWGIELKETQELIGNISVVKIIDDIESLELGWVLGRKYWGYGYIAEAAKKIVDFLFNQVGANRIYARHDVSNSNSGRVMQKAGMTYEGTLRQSARNKHGIVDMAYYSILESTWNRRSL